MNEIANIITNALTNARNAMNDNNTEVHDALIVAAKAVMRESENPEIRQLADFLPAYGMMAQTIAMMLAKLKMQVIKDPNGNPIGVVGGDEDEELPTTLEELFQKMK